MDPLDSLANSLIHFPEPPDAEFLKQLSNLSSYPVEPQLEVLPENTTFLPPSGFELCDFPL